MTRSDIIEIRDGLLPKIQGLAEPLAPFNAKIEPFEDDAISIATRTRLADIDSAHGYESCFVYTKCFVTVTQIENKLRERGDFLTLLWGRREHLLNKGDRFFSRGSLFFPNEKAQADRFWEHPQDSRRYLVHASAWLRYNNSTHCNEKETPLRDRLYYGCEDEGAFRHCFAVWAQEIATRMADMSLGRIYHSGYNLTYNLAGHHPTITVAFGSEMVAVAEWVRGAWWVNDKRCARTPTALNRLRDAADEHHTARRQVDGFNH